VGTLVIVVRLPSLEHGLGFGERGKPKTGEALMSEAAVEGFADGVVDGLAGPTEIDRVQDDSLTREGPGVGS
jgi:hypothetical protein